VGRVAHHVAAAGHIALGQCLGGVLGHRAPVDAEASGHLGLLAAGLPVDEDFYDIDHSECSPCHGRSPSRLTRSRLRARRDLDRAIAMALTSANGQAIGQVVWRRVLTSIILPAPGVTAPVFSIGIPSQ
jgi:hypothetical protein